MSWYQREGDPEPEHDRRLAPIASSNLCKVRRLIFASHDDRLVSQVPRRHRTLSATIILFMCGPSPTNFCWGNAREGQGDVIVLHPHADTGSS